MTTSTVACLELLKTTSVQEGISLDFIPEHDPHAPDAERAAQTVATP
jgi:hypothetical protein